MATTALVRSRRDENAQRRQGTGRHTTKRDFSFNLFGLLAAPASGFKTRLPLAQRSVSQQQLHSVDESAGSCSAAGVAACEAAHAEHIAQPDARMADQPQPEAFDPAHAPTPFRISNKVMRTPAAGKDTGDSGCERTEAADTEPAALPMAAFDDAADVATGEDVTTAEAADHDDGSVAGEEELAPVAGDAVAMPHEEWPPDATPSVDRSPVAAQQEERLRKSMGTSPIASELLLPPVATPASEPASRSAPDAGSGPRDSETPEDDCSPAGGAGSDGGSPACGASPAFDDTASMAGDDEDVHGATLEPGCEMPPPPMPSLGALLQHNMPPPQSRPRKGPGSARKRKTSLDKIGRLPGTAIESTGLVVDENGGRRSKRHRIQPLEFWRNERLEYGRRDSAKFAVPVAVTLQPKEATPKWVQRARARTGTDKAGANHATTKRAKKAAGPR